MARNEQLQRILDSLKGREKAIEDIKAQKRKVTLEGNKRRNKAWKERNPEHVAELDRQKAIRSYHKNHEENKRRQRDWHKKLWDNMTPEQRTDFKLKRTYGFGLEYRDELLTKQGNVCAVCKTADPGKRGWNMDHCHDKKHIRGVLCTKCNTGLGMFCDNIEILQSAIEYLVLDSNRKTT